MLKVQNISINYEAQTVVRDISLALERSKIIALLGANGAGKTSLLKALNGSLPLAKGKILLNDKPLNEYSRREIAQKIAVIAQETETKFPVSVLEFVLAGRFSHGTAFGWETEKDLQVARECLEMCDLENYDARQMNRLSGGERQRVVLARALATQAQILLLDEPTNNLDLAHQAMMIKLIGERCKSCHSSAVIITHDLNLASEFADEIILLKDGKIHAKGEAGKVLTEENIKDVFNVDVLLDENPLSKKRRVTAIY